MTLPLKTPLRSLALALLVCVLVLAACGQEDDAANTVQGVADATAPPTPAPADPADDTARDQAALALEDPLVILQDQRIMVLYPGTAEPQVIDEGIDESKVFQSPISAILVYSKPMTAIYNHELRAVTIGETVGETASTVTLDDVASGWQLALWSPDGEWVMTREGNRLLVHHTQGHRRFQVNGSQAFWLQDGTVLTYEQEMPPGGRIIDAWRYETDTWQTIELGFDAAALNTEDANIFTVLQENDLSIYAGLSPFSRSDSRFSPRPESFNSSFCQRWDIVTFVQRNGSDVPEQQTVYANESAYRISNLTDLPDGDVLFLEWVLEGCDIDDPPQVALRRLDPDTRAATTVVDDIFGGISFNQFGGSPFSGNLPLLAVTPDGTQVIYVSGGLDTGVTAVEMLDLASGATTELFSAPLQLQDGSYPAITGIYLLAERPPES